MRCRLTVSLLLRTNVWRYEKALSDCHLAMAQLRNNSVIDYKQLGLQHLLHAWEVLYNTAVILCHLGKWESAEQKITEAARWVPGEIRNAKLEAASVQIKRQRLLQPIHVADGEIFRPRKQEVEQLNSKDFLGKPKVISSVVPNDQYSGFEPLRPQRPGFYQPHREAMPGQGAGYHRVMVHYYPEDSGEVAVKANSILFVLTKHGDWATAIHDGQKILIPTNFLEPVDAPKADMKKINNGIPPPPMKMPPTRPNAKTSGTPLPSQQIPPRPTADPPLSGDSLKRQDPDSPPKQDQVVFKTDHEEDKEEMEKKVPSGEEPVVDGSVHLGPVVVTEPMVIQNPTPTKPLRRVEMAVMLQRSAPINSETDKENVCQEESSQKDGVITIQVHTEFTVDLSVSKNTTYEEFQRLLRDSLKQQGEQMKIDLRYLIQSTIYYTYHNTLHNSALTILLLAHLLTHPDVPRKCIVTRRGWAP
ncbi:hypothetical protein GDO81_014910 [Engystomops pustulosus]|uniref:SH3 domain-containing protein n=1 Tax=Engystomops pustulosus TaxID=76066 RepID=A0AAV7AJZ0_ENGPU|nr:hypothetical protein GDO81_014910 [Engystomops pustulosus]